MAIIRRGHALPLCIAMLLLICITIGTITTEIYPIPTSTESLHVSFHGILTIDDIVPGILEINLIRSRDVPENITLMILTLFSDDYQHTHSHQMDTTEDPLRFTTQLKYPQDSPLQSSTFDHITTSSPRQIPFHLVMYTPPFAHLMDMNVDFLFYDDKHETVLHRQLVKSPIHHHLARDVYFYTQCVTDICKESTFTLHIRNLRQTFQNLAIILPTEGLLQFVPHNSINYDDDDDVSDQAARHPHLTRSGGNDDDDDDDDNNNNSESLGDFVQCFANQTPLIASQSVIPFDPADDDDDDDEKKQNNNNTHNTMNSSTPTPSSTSTHQIKGTIKSNVIRMDGLQFYQDGIYTITCPSVRIKYTRPFILDSGQFISVYPVIIEGYPSDPQPTTSATTTATTIATSPEVDQQEQQYKPQDMIPQHHPISTVWYHRHLPNPPLYIASRTYPISTPQDYLYGIINVYYPQQSTELSGHTQTLLQAPPSPQEADHWDERDGEDDDIDLGRINSMKQHISHHFHHHTSLLNDRVDHRNDPRSHLQDPHSSYHLSHSTHHHQHTLVNDFHGIVASITMNGIICDSFHVNITSYISTTQHYEIIYSDVLLLTELSSLPFHTLSPQTDYIQLSLLCTRPIGKVDHTKSIHTMTSLYAYPNLLLPVTIQTAMASIAQPLAANVTCLSREIPPTVVSTATTTTSPPPASLQSVPSSSSSIFSSIGASFNSLATIGGRFIGLESMETVPQLSSNSSNGGRNSNTLHNYDDDDDDDDDNDDDDKKRILKGSFRVRFTDIQTSPDIIDIYLVGNHQLAGGVDNCYIDNVPRGATDPENYKPNFDVTAYLETRVVVPSPKPATATTTTTTATPMTRVQSTTSEQDNGVDGTAAAASSDVDQTMRVYTNVLRVMGPIQQDDVEERWSIVCPSLYIIPASYVHPQPEFHSVSYFQVEAFKFNADNIRQFMGVNDDDKGTNDSNLTDMMAIHRFIDLYSAQLFPNVSSNELDRLLLLPPVSPALPSVSTSSPSTTTTTTITLAQEQQRQSILQLTTDHFTFSGQFKVFPSEHKDDDDDHNNHKGINIIRLVLMILGCVIAVGVIVTMVIFIIHKRRQYALQQRVEQQMRAERQVNFASDHHHVIPDNFYSSADGDYSLLL